MKPYAFVYTGYSRNTLEVFPSLKDLVDYAKEQKLPPKGFVATAYYDNLTNSPVNFNWLVDAGFIILNETIDVPKVIRKIDERREASKIECEKWTKQGILISGLAPYYLMDRDEQIRGALEEASYDWR